MSIDDKKIESKITIETKNEYKKLLSELSQSIKKTKQSISIKIDVDEKVWKLSWKIDELETQQQANDFLNDVKEELQVLKEYTEYKDLFELLEKKVEFFQKQIKKDTKNQLWELQQQIFENKKPTNIVSKASEWRKIHAEFISWIVDSLVKKWGFLWYFARLANWEDKSK